MSAVPEVFKNLTSLKTINLEENSIDVFPIVFIELKKLEVLNLAANKLKSLPESVHSLSVVELNLNRNRLASLPLQVAQCRNLKVLRLAENCLPLESIHKEILTESSVSTLELEGNVFLMKDLHQKDGYDQVHKVIILASVVALLSCSLWRDTQRQEGRCTSSRITCDVIAES